MKSFFTRACVGLFLFAATAVSPLRAQGTAITYQGQIQFNGTPATGVYDLQFSLFNALASGAQQGPTVTVDDLGVTNGLFTAVLDFGNTFPGAERYLQIAVRPGASTGAYATLTPRQPLTSAPYAVRAREAGSITGTLAAGQLTGSLPDARLSTNVALRAGGNHFTGNQSIAGNLSFGTQARQMLNLWNAQYGIGVQAEATYFRSGGHFAWYQGGLHADSLGDAGPGGSVSMFLNQNGQLGLGTAAPEMNVDVMARQSTGRWTTTNDQNGAVLTLRNTSASPTYLGALNFETGGDTPGQIGYFADDRLGFRVAGGERMSLNASGLTLQGRIASGAGQSLELFVGGSRALRLEPSGTDSPNVIGGFSGNVVSNGVYGAFVGGGGTDLQPNRVGASYASVLGGYQNTASGWASVASGRGSIASGEYAAAFGYFPKSTGNSAFAAGLRSAAEGAGATALGSDTTASGAYSTALGFAARATHFGSFVWSGKRWGQFGDWFDSTADSQFAVRAPGGFYLDGRLGVGISSPSYSLDIRDAQAVGRWATTNNPFGAVLVLNNSTASPDYLGAINFESNGNTVGQIGYLADDRLIFTAGGAERMSVQAGLLTVNGVGNEQAYLSGGGGVVQIGSRNPAVTAVRFANLTGTPNPWMDCFARTFQAQSDRNAKQDFKRVEPASILEKVVALPITEWAYKGDTETRHVGPVAQDFKEAFGLGSSDKSIATVDADGVALAAIQGLNQKLESEVTELRSENTELKQRLDRLERMLSRDGRE